MAVFQSNGTSCLQSLTVIWEVGQMRTTIAVLATMLAVAGAAPSVLSQASSQEIAEHQQAAQQAEARDDFARAVEEYRLLTTWLPDNGQVWSNLGVALYFHNEFDRAADVMRHAIALNRELYSPHLFLGLSEARLSQPDSAIAELKKAIAINGADVLPHTWLGYEYVAQSNYERAVEQLKIASKSDAHNADIWYVLGQCYLDDDKEAIRQLWRVAPDGGRTWQLAAEQFEIQGSKDGALRAYLGALKRRPDVAAIKEKIIALGGSVPVSAAKPAGPTAPEDVAYERVREYEREAKAAFEQVSEIDPDSSRAHQIQGDSDVAADRFDDAISEYKAALAHNDRLPGVHGALCYAMSRVGQLQDALGECDKEIEIAPYSAEAYVAAGRVHLLANNDAKAEALLTKATTLDRPPVVAFKFLSQIYAREQKYPDAVRVLRKYLAEEKTDSAAYYLLARACKYTGDTEGMNEAIAAFKRTSEAAKNTSEAHKALTADPYGNDPSAAGEQKD
jgi:tetratricopeptide (TPR) repeat protein